MKILGISAYYHDSASALVVDGKIIAAAQEERFSRKKHDAGLPVNAIGYCLAESGLTPDELDAVVYYENPLLKLDRTLTSAIAKSSVISNQFISSIEKLFGSRLWVADQLRNTLGKLGTKDKLLFVEHHLAHAASAFYPSPFERAAIITIDGVGEWATTTIGHGEGSDIKLLQEINYPHSLGLLYSAFTYYCGFKVNSGEYKLMGLAPYGNPQYADLINENLIDLKADGSFRLNTEYFSYIDGDYMINERFEKLFGAPPRQAESRILQRHMDLAASVQSVLENVVLRICRHAKNLTGANFGVLAGGVALNCVANGKILREEIFDKLWVQPASGDAGGALGAALAISHCYYKTPRHSPKSQFDMQNASLLGPAFTNSEIQNYLNHSGYPYEFFKNDDELYEQVASHMAEGKIIGYLRGRMEFGPRALGARSILGDPRNPEMQTRMNLKIKYRESFRPFAPAIKIDRVKDYFDLNQPSPYMLLVAPVRHERRFPFDVNQYLENNDYDMLSAVNAERSDIPAVTHVDYSARIQTVDPLDHPEFYALLSKFEEKTGCPVCINTSFNVRGEPIVCTPEDAYRCFMRTDIDVLVLQNCVLHKCEQPEFNNDTDWKNTYELD